MLDKKLYKIFGNIDKMTISEFKHKVPRLRFETKDYQSLLDYGIKNGILKKDGVILRLQKKYGSVTSTGL